MAGTRGVTSLTVGIIVAESALAGTSVTANLNLLDFALPIDCFIGGIKVRAEVAGTGTGNTVVDILLNGTSIWDVAGDKPYLLATATGEFTSKVPSKRRLRANASAGGVSDHLTIKVLSVSSTGHGRVSVGLTLERAIERGMANPGVGGFSP